MPKKNYFSNIISIFLVIPFLLNSLSLPESGEIKTRKIYVPPDWGHFQALSSREENNPDVVIIADSHCVPDVQRRIHFIIRLLAKQGFRHVALEGAKGSFNPGFFQMMPDQEIAREIADFWMKEGTLTGAEWASIFSKDSIELYGIESRTPYLKSLGIVREAPARYSEIQEDMIRFGSPEPHPSLILEKMWADFQTGSVSLNRVIREYLSRFGAHGYLFFPQLTQVLNGKEILDFMQFWISLENLHYLAEEAEAAAAGQIYEIRRWKLCYLVRKMISFQMTRWEWDFYRVLKQEIISRSSEIKEVEEKYNKEFLKLIPRLAFFENFYELCRVRDKALAEEFIQYQNKKSFKRGVIIAGGFHVQGVSDELRSRGLHVGIVFPAIGRKVFGDAEYLKVLLGGRETEHNFRRFEANAVLWNLAPASRLGITNFEGPSVHKAFFAASIALYELLTAVHAKDLSGWKKVLSESRENWKDRYARWLKSAEIPEEERNQLLDIFTHVQVLDVKQRGPVLTVMLQLFGYQTEINVSLKQESGRERVFDVTFAQGLPFQAWSNIFHANQDHAVLRRTLSGHFPKKLKAAVNDPLPIRDYVEVYNRACFLREKLARGGGWRAHIKSFLESSDRPHLEKIHGALAKPVGQKSKFLKMLKSEMAARGIEVDFEVVDPEDSRIQGRLLICEKGVVLIHPEARVGDVLFYLPHEMIHLAGGSEEEARLQDAEMIARLKGLSEKLRKSVKNAELADEAYVLAKADLIELDALDRELDLHTARLESFSEGQSFLKRNSLGRLEDVSPSMLQAMAETTESVIDSYPFKLGSGKDVLTPAVLSLNEKSKSASDKRSIFDIRLLNVLTKKFLEMSIRGFILKKHGESIPLTKTADVDETIEKKNKWNISRGFIYVFISAVLAGFMPLMGHGLMQQYPVYSVLLIRDLIVGILLLPFVISKKVQNPTWRQFLLITLLGFVMTGIGDPLYYEGLKRSSPVSAFLIYSSAVLFLMTLASRFIFKERLSAKKWIGALLTFSSAFLIALGGTAAASASSILGALMIFGSAVTAAIWTILAKNLLKNLNPIFLITIAFWTGLPILLYLSGGNFAVAASPMIWVFSAITALVYVLYYRGLKWVSALTVSILDLTSPMFTSLFSAIQRMKIPGFSELGALVLSTIGVLTYISSTSKTKPHKKKTSDAKLDEWVRFGKEVAENLESFVTADDGMTIPQVVDVSDLEEDHGPSDIVEALSYYVHQSNVPNTDVYNIIFHRLGRDRGIKLLLDARRDIRDYLDTEEHISDDEFEEQMKVVRNIESELKQRFYSQGLFREFSMGKDKSRQVFVEAILARAA